MAPVISPGQDISSAVTEWIEKNDVMVFSKTTCPFCIKLKKTFKGKRIEFVSVELNTMGEDGAKIQEELLKRSGQKTVPNVFVRGKHIGERKIMNIFCNFHKHREDIWISKVGAPVQSLFHVSR